MGATGKYFSNDELKCKCGCGQNHMEQEFVDLLDKLREILKVPLKINSAYRCPEYNRKMGYTQTHSTGQAADIQCSHRLAYDVLALAETLGFTGIGIKQHGEPLTRFIHLDNLPPEPGRPRPHVWGYK